MKQVQKTGQGILPDAVEARPTKGSTEAVHLTCGACSPDLAEAFSVSLCMDELGLQKNNYFLLFLPLCPYPPLTFCALD